MSQVDYLEDSPAPLWVVKLSSAEAKIMSDICWALYEETRFDSIFEPQEVETLYSLATKMVEVFPDLRKDQRIGSFGAIVVDLEKSLPA